MKSTVKFAVAALLLCSLILPGCQSANSNTSTDTTTPQETTAPETENDSTSDDTSEWIRVDQLEIQNDGKGFTVTSYYSPTQKGENGISPQRKLIVEPKNKAESSYEILLGDPGGFVEPLLFAVDVTQDRYTDILVLDYTRAYGENYTAVVWDQTEHSFVLTTGFERITNFSVQTDSYLIRGSRSGDRSEEYTISRYDPASHLFILTDSLLFEFSSESEGDEIKVSEYHLQEGKSKTDTFTLPNEDNFRENTKIKSSWRLDSDYWKPYSSLYTDLHRRAVTANDMVSR